MSHNVALEDFFMISNGAVAENRQIHYFLLSEGGYTEWHVVRLGVFIVTIRQYIISPALSFILNTTQNMFFVSLEACGKNTWTGSSDPE